jgi:hypothetical protein
MLSTGEMHHEGRQKRSFVLPLVADIIVDSLLPEVGCFANGRLLWARLGAGRTGGRPCPGRLADDQAVRRPQ